MPRLSCRFPSSFPFQIEPNDSRSHSRSYSRSHSVSTPSFPIPMPRCLKFPFQIEPNDSRSYPAHVAIPVPFPSHAGRIWTRLYPSQRELRKVTSGSHSRDNGSKTNFRLRRARRSHSVPRVPAAPVARDETVSPAEGGNDFGSHCRGNGIPRSLFSAPVGMGINESYASDEGWEWNGNCHMRGMGTGVVGFYMEREFQTT